jgi:translation initiation factor eIF-2B subunit epsilon
MTEEIKERDVLTAVIIADSFTRSFWPITNDLPKVLMPLCNIPLIEYTLELVIRNNIKKVILFCSSLAGKVLEYYQTQKYRQVSITIISRPACQSLGDVMRELYNKKAIRNDFLIFYGDLVGNANLKHAIDQHHKVKEADKDFILTVVFSEVPIKSNLRIEEEQCVVVLEGHRILQYDQCNKKRGVKMNSNVKFKDLKEFEVRFDLIESGVLICSPEVMGFFSEEFDYHSLRDHLMRDVLTSEIYTSKFSAYVLPKHYYLQRVHVPRSYDGVSVDLMNRWLHPICLDANLFPPSTPSTYTSSRNNLYKEQNVHLARGVRIETPAVIGSDTVIHEDSVISMSSIGRNCIVQSGCRISNSYIWNNVRIGKNCIISHSIICNGAVIGDNCQIKSGSIVSFNVELNSGIILEERSRVSLYKFNKEEKSYQLSNEPSELGKGFLFDAKLEERLEEVSEHLIKGQSIGGFPEFLEVDSERSQDSDDESSSSQEQVAPQGKFIGKERKN